jgi:hypothetical protein
MGSKVRFSGVAIFLLLMPACGSETPRMDVPARPNFLSMGDPGVGRVAFVELECNKCHEVAGDDFGTRPVANAGPQLGTAHAEWSPSEIAGAIVLPSHTISDEPGPWKATAVSSMTDYSGMTVRQLEDIIAYLRTPARDKDSLP